MSRQRHSAFGSSYTPGVQYVCNVHYRGYVNVYPSARMRSEGYSTFLSVCLSVCYHASEGIARFYAKKEIRTVLV